MSPEHHHILSHSRLGSIRGVVVSEGVVQYRNIPFAVEPERWAHSQVLNKLPTTADGIYEATAHGPMPPQPEGSINFDFGLIQKSLPVEQEIVIAEKGCLNLVVTAPVASIPNVPVMVFIHGGGFFLGCNSWPQYDLGRLVRQAANIGKPIVGVGINYRLGVLGFLNSPEIDNGSSPGNYGLLDQACALQWIQNHIADFGGDPDRVTLFGESAGAISTSLQIFRGKPLFSRAICMSGGHTLRPPKSSTAQAKYYDQVAEKLGLQDLLSNERAEKLRATPAELLVTLPENFMAFPSAGTDYPNIEQILLEGGLELAYNQPWCKALMVGDCDADGYVYSRVFSQHGWQKKLQICLRECLDAEQISKLLDAYNIDLSPCEGLSDGLMHFVTDVRFYMPLLEVANSWRRKDSLFVYHLQEGNPFPGPCQGRATHVLDITLILQNYEDHLEVETKELARTMARTFIEFAYEDDALRHKCATASNGTIDQIIVWGGEQKGRELMSGKDFDRTERGGRAALLHELGLKGCSRVLDLFQGLA